MRHRNQPWVHGTVWDTAWREFVIIKWDDREENAYVRDPSVLEKITPRRGASGRADKAPEDAPCAIGSAKYGKSLLGL